MLEVAFEGDTRLDSLGRRLRVASEKKMVQLTGILYDKVIENVSGKILQKQSEQLAGSIHQDLDLTGEVMLGTVYPDPADGKAWALEKGGKGYYTITATKADLLHFFSKDYGWVRKYQVNHPPSREFAYLRTALEEVAPMVPRGFQEYIQAVLDGGDYG